MESNGVDPARSDTVLDSLQFTEELRRLMAVSAPENGSSFTALLELPAPQAVELLHAPESGDGSAGKSQGRHCFNNGSFQFPTNGALIERAAKYSVFAAESNGSPASSSVCSKQNVKCEGAETGSNPNSGLGQQQPSGSDPMEECMAQRSVKRKEREKKAKGSSKKSKNESSEDAEKLPCVHVRARRGQATDSHSLAERARREKINARMKLLQELVPGCNKISGTALVLDEIINHVQSLQRQVELLSMKLAAVNPRVDFDLDSILGAEGGPLVDNNYSGFVMAPQWPDINTFGSRQQYQQQWHFDALHLPIMGRGEENQNLVTPENSLLSYDSSVNSVSLHQNLHPNHVKMEL